MSRASVGDAVLVRDYRAADGPAILALNQANQPEVGPMDEAKLAWFADHAPFFKVVERASSVCGFLIGLTDAEEGYPSPNYRWFAERYDRFAYVDRVALSPANRGQGIGPMLYFEFASWATAAGKPTLCAEVNTVPENPRSLRFHDIFGFGGVGRCQPYGGEEEVAMLAKSLVDIH